MVQITEDIEFIIGLDIGHGETAASFFSIKNEEKMDLDILPNSTNKAIPSAVAILEQEGKETICIGQAAINLAPYSKDFQIAFKKRPSEMNIIERRRMVYFMRGVYAAILDRYPDFKTRKHAVYIARPSQDKIWKSEEDAYIQIAEDAGIPIAGIHKESRAAYFRARTQPDSKIDNEVKTGVLIVDYGSSTIDFTYLNKHLTNTIDDGCNLGASEVERVLLEYAMTNPQDPYMPEFVKLYGNNKDSIPYQQMLFKFREAKEGFYGGKLLDFSVAFDYGLLTCSEGSPIIGHGGITIRRNDVNKILGENTHNGYIERVKDAIKKFKDEKLKDNKVVCVYLTGGASRMDFVRQIFMDIFQLDERHCPFDSAPSLIVAQGVAHLSYADMNTEKKAQEIRDYVAEMLMQYDWETELRDVVCNVVKKEIISIAQSVMLSYKNGFVFEYLLLDNGTNISGEYINMQSGKPDDGCVAVRNIRSLRDRFENSFKNLVNYDYAKECANVIKEKILNLVEQKIKTIFKAYNYSGSLNLDNFDISGLSVFVTPSGIKELSEKFTGQGDGHIIYDAVKSCYPFGAMVGFNLLKDRWDADRKQHYDYYMRNDSEIYGLWTWSHFLNRKVATSGIKSIKKQTEDYVNKLVDDYVSFARLAILFE